MNYQRSLFIFFSLFFFTTSSLNGQSGFGLNTGFIKPFAVISNDVPYTSGSAHYDGSFFISATYRKKTGKRLFLGTSLHFQNYQLNFHKKNAIHPGLDEYTRDIKYKFNYLNLTLYPEFIFGQQLKYYVNAGVSAGLLLNAHKSGTYTHMRMHSGGPDGHYAVYTVTEEEGDARNDFKSFIAGFQIGTGLRYIISDDWDINLDISCNFIPSPVEDEFVKSQFDLLISVGMEYTINKNK